MPAPGTWSRRSLLLTGAGLAAAGCSAPFGAGSPPPVTSSTPVPSPPERPSASPTAATPIGIDPSARFDLAAQPKPALRGIRLHEPDSTVQGIGYDIANHRTFAVQGRDGRPGADLCINQLDRHGTVVGHVHVDDAGHGQSFGVESVGRASYLWLEWDATENTDAGRGTALARFRFVAGRRPHVATFFGGSREVGCAIDPVAQRLLVRRWVEGSDGGYSLYDLADAGDGDFSRPLAVIHEPPLEQLQPTGGRPVLQAFTGFGSYVYTWFGTGGHSGTAADPFNSYLSAIDLRTGELVQQQLVEVDPSLEFREPEALAVDVVNGAPRLCFGFASRPRPDSRRRLANIYYLDTLR